MILGSFADSTQLKKVIEESDCLFLCMASYIDLICPIIRVLFIGIQKGKKEAHCSVRFVSCLPWAEMGVGFGVGPHIQMAAVQGERLASKFMF